MRANTWRCEDTDAHLDELLMGELGRIKRAAFGAHRAQCARCNAAIAQGVRTVGALRALAMESPSPDLTERVLAARTVPDAAPRVSLVRLTEVTVVWAVCVMVALISIALLIEPNLLRNPGEYSIAWLGSAIQAVHAAALVGSAAVASVPALVWAGLAFGFAAFYAAALTGLRVFLIRRST